MQFMLRHSERRVPAVGKKKQLYKRESKSMTRYLILCLPTVISQVTGNVVQLILTTQ